MVTVKAQAAPRSSPRPTKHKGALYKYGAAGPKRFDCSGYTMYVYRKTVGAQAPAQGELAAAVRQGRQQGRKKPGDLIVFRVRLVRLPRRASTPAAATCTTRRTPARACRKRKMFSNNYVVRRLV